MSEKNPILANNPSINEELTNNYAQTTDEKSSQFKSGSTFGMSPPLGSKNKGQLALEAIGQENAETILQKSQVFNRDFDVLIENINIASSHILEEIRQRNISRKEGSTLTKDWEYKRNLICKHLTLKLDQLEKEWEENF